MHCSCRATMSLPDVQEDRLRRRRPDDPALADAGRFEGASSYAALFGTAFEAPRADDPPRCPRSTSNTGYKLEIGARSPGWAKVPEW